MYNVFYSARFKKDMKRIASRGRDGRKLKAVIELLAAGTKLPEKYRDHLLAGNWEGCRECHIEPDWLLVYIVDNGKLILTLTRTGSHSDLFG